MSYIQRLFHGAKSGYLPRVLTLTLLLVLPSCGVGAAPVASQAHATPLSSSIDRSRLSEFYSSKHDISFSYPSDWIVVEGSESVYVVPSEDHLPWGIDSQPLTTRKTFELYTRAPYDKRGDRMLGTARSASEMAQASVDVTVDLGTDRLVQPVDAVDVNGHDGATFLVSSHGRDYYYIMLRLARRRVLVLSASGPPSAREEMQEIAKVIAVTSGPLED